MKSYDEVIDIIHEYEPYLTNDICKVIISFLCPNCPGSPCSKCGIGNKYLYYNHYKKSISIIHKWILEKCFMKTGCSYITRRFQIYGEYTYSFCHGRVLKTVYAKYGTHLCCKHKINIYIKK